MPRPSFPSLPLFLLFNNSRERPLTKAKAVRYLKSDRYIEVGPNA